jgi:hypothetical protein
MTPAHDQRIAALQRANETRNSRVELRGRVHRGELPIAEALEHDAVASMWVFDVALWPRGFGRSRALQALRRAEITAVRRCGELTERQRRVLAEELGR